MHVSAGRAVGCIDVGVSVNPDEADVLVLTPIEFRHARNRSRSNGMIATQSNRHLAGFQRLDHEFCMLGAGRSNLLQILCMRITFLLLLGNSDGYISGVFNNVSQRVESRLEAGNTKCGRLHIHAAARLTEVERNPNDANLPGRDAGEGWSDIGHKFGLTYFYGYNRCSILGNGIVSRTCSRPQIHATARSIPMPKPACGTPPNLRRSRYHLNASSGSSCL